MRPPLLPMLRAADGAAGKLELLAGMGYQEIGRKPLVYVYELPPRFNTWRNLERHDRPLYVHIWQRLLSSGHRTADPQRADYFFVPVDFR